MKNELRNFKNFSYLMFLGDDFFLKDLRKGFIYYDVSENITIKLYPKDIINISQFYDFNKQYSQEFDTWMKGVDLFKKFMILKKRGFSPKNILFRHFPLSNSRDGDIIFLKKSVTIRKDNIKDAIAECDEAITFYNQNLKEKDLLSPPRLTLEKDSIKVIDAVEGFELSLTTEILEDFLKYFDNFILKHPFTLEFYGKLDTIALENLIEELQVISSILQNILKKENADFHHEILELVKELYRHDEVLSVEE